MATDDRTNIGFLLHDVARALRMRFDERARSLGVTRQQWRALLNLARRPAQTQAELADALEVERITLCRMIDRLTEAGFVERRGDPADRRVWRLHLTPEAEKVVGELARIGRDLEEEALRCLSPQARADLIESLRTMRDGLARMDVQGRTATA